MSRLKAKRTYYQLLVQFVFIVTLSFFTAKPIINFVNHLGEDSSDIELVEDVDEEDSENETESESEKEIEFDEVLICSHMVLLDTETDFEQNEFTQYVSASYFEVYTDILIPPPKS